MDIRSQKCARRGALLGDLPNVPVALDDLVVGRDVVAHERQDLHDHVLRHAHHVGACPHAETPLKRKGGASCACCTRCFTAASCCAAVLLYHDVCQVHPLLFSAAMHAHVRQSRPPMAHANWYVSAVLPCCMHHPCTPGITPAAGSMRAMRAAGPRHQCMTRPSPLKALSTKRAAGPLLSCIPSQHPHCRPCRVQVGGVHYA